MNENDTPRAEHVIPPGFRPLQFPQVVDLDKQANADDEPMIVAQGDLRVTAEALASMELLATILDKDRRGGSPIARQIADMARFWKGHVRLIGGIAAVVALAVVGAVLPVGGTASAQAMEAPQPDLARVVAQRSVAVVLNRATVTVRVRVTTAHVTPAGRWCASLWAPTSYGQGFAGRTCAAVPTFTVTGTLDARYVPVGRSRIAVTDDVAPLDTVPASVTLIARRPSKFGPGVWTPTQFGDGLTVYAAMTAYTPALGRWTPQQASPVQVQELRGGRWVTVAAGTTNRYGTFLIAVIVGGGPHTLRVHRDAGATVAAVNGTPRPFYLYPTDVPDGTV